MSTIMPRRFAGRLLLAERRVEVVEALRHDH
jgi:hypothetical protein